MEQAESQRQDKKEVWDEVLASLRVSVSSAIFSTWISQTHLISLKKLDKTRYIAEVGCASAFVKATVEKRYFGLTQDSIMKVLGSPCDLTFSVKALPKEQKEDGFAPLFEEPKDDELIIEKTVKARLRPDFTFENYAVSGSNQMAHAAAEAVAKTPGVAYNPLFIWGGVGVGKTHLMHAVGRRILQSKPNSQVFACTGEDFTNDIVEGIRNKTTHTFRNKYRKLDVLLVDDIQFIAGKETIQEEFFHTFNAVTSAGGQVIMTSDRPPSEIPKLEERLKSRFEAGLNVDIAAPDFELRCAIIQIKSREREIPLEMEHIHLIAGNIDSARKIEGVLTRIMSEAKIRGLGIDEELIKKLISAQGGSVDGLTSKKKTADDIINAVCTHYSVGKRAIMGKARTKTIALPRQVLMYLLRIELQLPLEEVGRLVGGRDHTTVMHGVDKITNLASEDVSTREDLLRIKQLS